MKFNIIAFNNRKFDVKRVIPADMVTDIMSATIKQLWDCDVVLKRNGKHYFVAEIVDAEYEDVVKKPTQKAVSGEISDTKG